MQRRHSGSSLCRYSSLTLACRDFRVSRLWSWRFKTPWRRSTKTLAGQCDCLTEVMVCFVSHAISCCATSCNIDGMQTAILESWSSKAQSRLVEEEQATDLHVGGTSGGSATRACCGGDRRFSERPCSSLRLTCTRFRGPVTEGATSSLSIVH